MCVWGGVGGGEKERGIDEGEGGVEIGMDEGGWRLVREREGGISSGWGGEGVSTVELYIENHSIRDIKFRFQ